VSKKPPRERKVQGSRMVGLSHLKSRFGFAVAGVLMAQSGNGSCHWRWVCLHLHRTATFLLSYLALPWRRRAGRTGRGLYRAACKLPMLMPIKKTSTSACRMCTPVQPRYTRTKGRGGALLSNPISRRFFPTQHPGASFQPNNERPRKAAAELRQQACSPNQPPGKFS
jgi:hypothetical protein